MRPGEKGDRWYRRQPSLEEWFGPRSRKICSKRTGCGLSRGIAARARKFLSWRSEVVLATVFRTFGFLSQRERRILIAITAARAATQILDVFALATIGVLASLLTSDWNDSTSTIFLGINFNLSLPDDLPAVAATCVVFFFSRSLLSILLLNASSLFMARVGARKSAKIADHVFSGGLSRILESSRGDVQWSVQGSVRTAIGLLETAATLLSELTLFILVFVLFLVVDVAAALSITLLFVVVLMAYQLTISRRLEKLGRRSAENSVVVGESVLDLFNTFRETSVSGRKSYFLDLFRQASMQLAIDDARVRVFMGLPRYLLESLLIICIAALMIWEFGSGFSQEGLTVTAVFLAGGFRMAAAALPLQNSYAAIKANAPSAERAQAWLAREDKKLGSQDRLSEPEEATRQRAGRHADRVQTAGKGFSVRLTNVTFSYPSARGAAVAGVNLEIEPGQVVALVGPSGAGKSTIADLLLGLLEPSDGEIWINGFEPKLALKYRTGVIAYVPQRPGVLSGTVAQNVALGLPQEEIDEHRVLAVLERAELGHWIHELERGVHTSLGAQGEALSGGQLQRLGLARALYHNPKLLVLDEATSALDPATEAGVAERLFRSATKTTTLIIAHRLSTVENADLVYVLDKGRIIASGPFDKLISEIPLMREYLRLSSNI